MSVSSRNSTTYGVIGIILMACAIGTGGCGGGASGQPVSPPFSPTDINGQWQFVAQSSATSGVTVINANFTQAGNEILADGQAVQLARGTRAANGIQFTALGGPCDSLSQGFAELQGLFSSHDQLSFSVIQDSGAAILSGQGTISSDGTHLTSGTYSSVVGCGPAPETGSINGFVIKPFNGTYSGTLTDGTNIDPITGSIVQDGLGVNFAGNDDGTSFLLTGTAIGGAFRVTGPIGDRTVTFIAIYEPATGDFKVFDGESTLLGTLQPGVGSFSISVGVTPATTNVQVNHARSFAGAALPDFQNQGVTWSLSGGGCSGSSCGTLSTNATLPGERIIYTAPAVVPAPSTVSIIATAVADTTKTGSAAITITTTPQLEELGPGNTPSLLVDVSGVIDLLWLQNQAVVFARSPDGGTTLANTSIPTSGIVSAQQLGSDGQGNVALLWQEPDQGNGEVAPTSLASSTDSGSTFSLRNASDIIGNVFRPALAVLPSGDTDITSAGTPPTGVQGIYSTIFTANGQNNQAPVQVAPDPSTIDNQLASAFGAQGQLYVAWVKGIDVFGECEIMFNRSVDGGATFSAPLNVSNNPANCAQSPVILVDSTGAVNLAWTTPFGFAEGGSTVMNPNLLLFARSTNQGVTFSAPVQIISLGQFDRLSTPKLAASPGAIDVVVGANADTDNPVALFFRSTDGGATFTHAQTPASKGANSPAIAIDSCGGIDVVWAGPTDVFFSRSTDGVTFSAPVDLSIAKAASFHLGIAADSHGMTYVVWDDSTQIFFLPLKVCP